ncbi:MAG: MarR family winged helix-turn-helix transcriptional regulator [Nocardioidaceae bacterium]
MAIERQRAVRLLESVVSLLRSVSTVAHRDTEHGVGRTPTVLLRSIRDADRRLGDLAERLGVNPSVASRAVAALEQQGYVERVPDPDDARACRVHLTGAGREYLQRHEDRVVQLVVAALDDCRASDVDRLIGVLHRLEVSVGAWGTGSADGSEGGNDAGPAGSGPATTRSSSSGTAGERSAV